MSDPVTLTQLFFEAIDRFSSKRAALRYKAHGEWQDMTHQELGRRVQLAALGLLDLGIRPGDRVAILSPNRPEWAIADFACLAAHCANVPVYPTLPADQVRFILEDCQASAIFVSDRHQYQKISEIQDELSSLKRIVTFDRNIDAPNLHTMEELYQRGAAAESARPDFKQEATTVQPDDLATLIYTSGTTGPPKGVMLSHGNITSSVAAALKILPVGSDDRCLSLLPLSHSFERTAGHYTMVRAGVTINYAENIDEVPHNLLEIKPTVVLAVPRLFEKMYARVLEAAMSGGAVKRRLFFWARRAAEAWADLKLRREAIPPGLAAKKRIADRLVFSKLKARTGGRLRYFVSGSAPLSPEIAKFFYAAGIPILEGYGLTESSPIISVNPLEAPKMGTVGRPVPGVEVRIASDGEILARGPNIMLGYYNRPAETGTAIDADGWLHTGDIGEIDDDGYLTITDRKKDLIVTATGKNIAPQPIENLIKTNKFVLNAVIVGNRRKFPSILVVPNVDALEHWATQRGILAEPGQFLEQPDVVAKVEREVMGSFRDLAPYEMPKKVLILEKDFTVESGELTPTLKVKRSVIEEHYRERIDLLYEDEPTG